MAVVLSLFLTQKSSNTARLSEGEKKRATMKASGAAAPPLSTGCAMGCTLCVCVRVCVCEREKEKPTSLQICPLFFSISLERVWMHIVPSSAAIERESERGRER